MALSGKIQKSWGPSSHYTLECDWSATQSITGNTSTITAQMKLYSDSGWSIYSSATKSGNISVNGTNKAISSSGVNTGGGAWINLGAAQTFTVTHNSDGTGSFTLDGDFAFNVTISGTYYGDIALTASTFTLDTIPRATTLSSPNPTNWTAGNNITFNLNRNSSGFSETVKLEVQDKSNSSAWTTVNTLTGQGSSATFSFTTAQNTIIFKALNGTTSTASRLTITTYSGAGSTGSLVGSAQSYTGTVSAPAVATASAPYFNIGDTVTITLSGTKSGYTYKLQWVWPSYSPIIATGISASSYSWNTSSADSTAGGTYASNMYTKIPTATYSHGNLVCTTYYNGYQVNVPTTSSNVYAYVVNSNPTFGTGYSYADTNPNVTTKTNNNQIIVQNLSTLTVTLPTTAKASALNSATMSYYVATINGVSVQQNYSGTASVVFNMGVVNATTNQTLSVKAVDSRGFSTTTSIPVTVMSYSPPVVNTTSKRDDGFSNPSTVTLSGTYSPLVIGGITKNPLKTVKYQYKKTSDSSYGTPVNFSYSTNNTSYTASNAVINSPDGLDSTASWNVQVIVEDQFNSITKTNVVGTGVPIVFIDDVLKSVGIGKFPTNANRLELANDIQTNWIYGNVGTDLTLSPQSGNRVIVNAPKTQFAADGQPSTTNTDTGAIRITGYNNLLQIGTGNTNNDRNAFIQSRHLDNAFSTIYGTLQLNPLGGSVTANGSDIVASGSNTNGNYVKYYDGTLMCYNSVSAVAGTTLKTISGLLFPFTFVGTTPYVFLTHRSVSGKFADYYVLNPTLSDFGIVHQGVASADLTGTIINWWAIGRWK